MQQQEKNEIGTQYNRPWGSYKTLEYGDTYQIKVISVNPQGKLSLQKHKHRSEHWVIVKGIATVTLSDTTIDYKAGEYVYIPKTAVHRVANYTKDEVLLVEVQQGSYLGEDDIIRIEDIYGR